ncbi:MAG: cytochrome c [Anaerolinea sp.]|nr:cytochrome c [Anaerolinea sp.]
MKALIAYVLLSIGSALAACQPAIVADRSELISEGEAIYTTSCARCHHGDGSGYRNLFPPLAGNPLVTLHDPVPIIRVVQDGRGSMPPFRGVLSSEEIAAVLTYIRNSWGNEAAPIPPRQVRD